MPGFNNVSVFEVTKALSGASRALTLYAPPIKASSSLRPWSVFENKLMALLTGLLKNQADQLAGFIADQGPGAIENASLWNQLYQETLSKIEPLITQTVMAGVGQVVSQNSGPGIQTSWNLTNHQAQEWARVYAAELVKNVTDTTKDRLRKKIHAWIESGQHLDALTEEIAQMKKPGPGGGHLFNRSRAEMIAQTETTRAFAEGNVLAWKELGYSDPAIKPPLHPRCRCALYPKKLKDGSKVLVWRTAFDERVCEQDYHAPWGVVHGCGGMHMLVVSNGPYMGQKVTDLGNSGAAPAIPKGPDKPKPGSSPTSLVMDLDDTVLPDTTPPTISEPAMPSNAPAMPGVTPAMPDTAPTTPDIAPIGVVATVAAESPVIAAPDLGYAAPDNAASPPTASVPVPISAVPVIDYARLHKVDLHEVEPTWGQEEFENSRYGGVIFDDQGRVLLRKPRGNFGGYAWTFPKGGGNGVEHPVDIATREVLEETGHDGEVIGIVPGRHSSGSSANYFFLMRSKSHDPSRMDTETEETIWVDYDEAKQRIAETTLGAGRKRDLAILDAAFEEHRKVTAGEKSYDYLFAQAQADEPEIPAATALPTPRSIPVEPPVAFPKTVDSLTTVRTLGGSTGAMLMRDPDTGKQFVLKRGKDAGHILEEATADGAYQALGFKVPAYHIYQTPAGPVKVAEYIEGKPLKEVLASGNTRQINKVKKELQKGFAADALMGNWDVVGLDADNVLVDSKGNVWRIDNGGSLRRRAQGTPKTPDQWNSAPTEIWTLRDPKVNPSTAKLYATVSYEEIAGQMAEIVEKRDEILAALPADLQPVVAERIETMGHLAAAAQEMGADGWGWDYQDGFAETVVNLRKDGIYQSCPSRLKVRRSGDYYNPLKVTDDQGKLFDGLRGTGSITTRIAAHINAAGGDYSIIHEYLSNQAGSSWSAGAQAFKYMVAKQRGLPLDTFYWRDGVDRARKSYEMLVRRYGKEKLEKTFEMYHAFTYEYLTKIDLPIKNPDGTFRLIRTENQYVLNNYGIQLGDTGKPITRGSLESFSAFKPYFYQGNAVTLQNVPASRIFATYMVERSPGSGHGSLAGDHENEFVVIPDGILTDYVEDHDET
jgi:ADP-ribose pyrophosphatase YjhB (NUDIX family)